MDKPTNSPDAAAMTPLEQALARLADTRAGLRQALLPPVDQGRSVREGGGHPGAAWPLRLRAGWRHWRRQLRRWPLAGVLLASAQEAWQRHPWRPGAELALREAGAAVLPAVRRHPVAAVALAAGLGMALVAGRRWYAPVLQVHARSAPSRLGRWLLRQLTQAPVQAGLVGLLAMLLKRGGQAAPDAGPAAATPDPAGPAASASNHTRPPGA